MECGVGKSNRKRKLSGVDAMIWYRDPPFMSKDVLPPAVGNNVSPLEGMHG